MNTPRFEFLSVLAARATIKAESPEMAIKLLECTLGNLKQMQKENPTQKVRLTPYIYRKRD